jgi:hypothetical protein
MPTVTVPVSTVVVVRLGMPVAVEVAMGVRSCVWVGVLDTAMAMAIALAAQPLVADSRLSGHFVEVSSGQNAGCNRDYTVRSRTRLVVRLVLFDYVDGPW